MQLSPPGTSRYLMRQVLKVWVPDTISERQDKAGTIFPATYEKWLMVYTQKTGKTLAKKSRQDLLAYQCFLFELGYTFSQ